jgi:hypothetical protein
MDDRPTSLQPFRLVDSNRVPRIDPAPVAATLSAPYEAMSRPVALALAFALAGCAQVATRPIPEPPPPPAATKPIAPNAEPPNPGINLSGFPLPYRQGYADGCASAKGTERKDATRFADDGNYRTGWQDGLSLCRKK